MTESELKQLTYLQKFNTMLIKKRIGKDSRKKQIIQASEIMIQLKCNKSKLRKNTHKNKCLIYTKLRKVCIYLHSINQSKIKL